MTEDTIPIPPHWTNWPPLMASRAERRDCAKRRHEGAIKDGYCALCGTQVKL